MAGRQIENKKDEEDRRQKRILSRLRATEIDDEAKAKKEEEEKKKAMEAEDLRKIDIDNLDTQMALLSKGMSDPVKKEREGNQAKMKLLLINKEKVENRKMTYEGTYHKYTTGGNKSRLRKVFVVSKHTGMKEAKKGREEQAEEMKGNMNRMLKTIKATDGKLLFRYIEEVRNGGTWGGPNEKRWLISGVPNHEERGRMRTQLEAACGVAKIGLGQVFANELNPSQIVVEIPEGMGEGADLVEKITSENKGILIIPRWPLRLGQSRKFRVEVRSAADARILIEKHTLKVEGQLCRVKGYENPEE